MSNAQLLGKYQLIAELARGGMGLVYLAINSGVGGFSKLLVIKELKPELVEDQGFLDMFLEEARLAARLNHPNIVTTYEVGIEGNRPFIVMDYLDGQTLSRVIRRRGEGFTLDMHVMVIAAMLDGLHYAHTREDFDGTLMSVVHRDVSPQNVFITYDGQIKLVDFGIAKASDTTVETRTGVFKGKPSYMAPEQLHGAVTPQSDVYSAGIMLWEAVVGRRMWQKKTDVEIMTALLKGQIPSIDEAAPDAPAELRRIITKAIAPALEDRYDSAKALHEDLEKYLEQKGARTNHKEIGAVVGKLFAEQRVKLRGIIEQCIAESKADAPSRSKLPSIAPPPDENSGPNSPVSGGSRGHTQRIATTPSGISPLDYRTPLSGTTPAGAFIESAPTSMPEPKPRTPILYMALGAILVLLIGGAVFVLRSPQDGAGTSETPHGSGSAAAAATPPSEPSVMAPPSTASAPASASAALSAAVSAAPKAPPQPRVVYVHPPPPKPTPPPPKPVTAQPPTPSPPSPAPPKADCNPPFFYEGTKKVYKPGCL